MVRLTLEQLADSIELPVGEPEGAVERLFCNPRQVLQSSRAVGWAGRDEKLRLIEGAPSLLPDAIVSAEFAPMGAEFAPAL
jgi:hypothetical protein